jgi:hypothetical protein
MGAGETLVRVGITFTRERAYAMQAYADGFVLRAWEHGESGQFRHWPLGRGWIATTGDNELREIGLHECDSRPIELPAAVTALPEGTEALLGWPAAVCGGMERRGDEVRYELRLARDDPDAWFAIAEDAWLGLSGDGALSRVIARARVPGRECVVVRVPADPFAAAVTAGRFLQVEREPSGVAEGWPASAEAYGRKASYEAARGNGYLSVGPGGVLTGLSVYDAVEGEAVRLDHDAPLADDGVDGWQEWPADVRASWWRDEGGVWVAVSFGEDPAEGWWRTVADVWVGTRSSGEIAAIVLRGEESGPAFWHHVEDEDAGPGELPRLARMAEELEALPFAVYGLAGELGEPGGFGSGFANVVSSLDVTFGEREGDRWLTVTSSREADLELARMNLVSDLLPPGDGPADHSRASMEAWAAAERERAQRLEREILGQPWLPVVIPVDGDDVEWWSARYGPRWAALTRLAGTTIGLVGQGYETAEVAVERITDLRPHAEHARMQEQERLARVLREHGHESLPGRPERSADDRARRASVRRVVDGLTDAIHNNAGAPDLGDLFTSRVVDGWGGRERYRDLLWVHTMLRPITGSGTTGDYPSFNPDGSADMRLSIHHAPIHGAQGVHGQRATFGFASSGGAPDPEPVPDRAAIDRGEAHPLDLRLVPDGDGWQIDTDLLAVLVDRIGPLDHVVQPLSRQGVPPPA